jgi:hypothetical protein
MCDEHTIPEQLRKPRMTMRGSTVGCPIRCAGLIVQLVLQLKAIIVNWIVIEVNTS